jgi:DNA-directed RNA polymerase specialized sigma24 family protein
MTSDSAQFAVTVVASDDLDLVHASKNGDVTSFEQLVKRYDGKLLRIAQHVTHNREDAQDAVQEAFLRLESSFWEESFLWDLTSTAGRSASIIRRASQLGQCTLARRRIQIAETL